MGDGERAGRRDAIGELQTHLIVYAKGVADTIWEVQQAREYDEQKARGPLTARQELRSGVLERACNVVWAMVALLRRSRLFDRVYWPRQTGWTSSSTHCPTTPWIQRACPSRLSSRVLP
jgi:hypothetical protein